LNLILQALCNLVFPNISPNKSLPSLQAVIQKEKNSSGVTAQWSLESCTLCGKSWCIIK